MSYDKINLEDYKVQSIIWNFSDYIDNYGYPIIPMLKRQEETEKEKTF